MRHTTVLLVATIMTMAAMMVDQRTGATPAIRPLSQRGIIFPKENYDDCFVDAERKVRGTCKKLADCPTAVERWEHEKLRPQTCYFIKFEHIVCCDKDELDEHLLQKEKKTTYFPSTTTTTPPPPTTTTTTPPTTTTTTTTSTTTTSTTARTTKSSYQHAHTKRSSEVACESYNDAKVNKDEDLFETTTEYIDVTASNEFSYMAAIGWRSKYDARIYFHCGGALISPRFVLTAAHCVELGGEPPALARIGGADLTDDHQLATDYEIWRAILHPAYNVSIVNNDIALLELKRAAAEQHTPACLWTKPELAHEDVTAVGYGQARLGSPTIQLLKVPLSVFSNEACETYFETPAELSLIRETVDGVDASSSSSSSNSRRTHICAGDASNLRDTCQGDAGGPLIVQTPHHYIVGITAFGFGCAGGPPSVYTRTAAYIEWLEEVVWPAEVVTRTGSTSAPPMTTTPLLDVRVDV